MELIYDARGDSASVLVGGLIVPGGDHTKDRLDEDRFVRTSDVDGSILEYEFLNVRRDGVRLDDLQHRDELTALFRDAGFTLRDWSTPVSTKVICRRRDSVAG